MSETRSVDFESGIRYLIPAELLEYFARTGGEPERALIEWGRRFLRPDGIFVDVGAHIGTYALSYAGEVKETHAFEAQENTYYRLCGGIAFLGNDSVHAHHIAISDENFAQAELKIPTSDGGLSSIEDLPNRFALRTERVICATLDSYNLDDVCLIKIDVEGAELRVLRGAVETIKRSGYPPLLVEVWLEAEHAERRLAVAAFLTELGYGFRQAEGFPHMLICEHESRKEPPPPVVENTEDDLVRRKRLVLTMIVKNESRVIRRGLQTMLPHVDAYVVCDTGSTDGTPGIIRSEGDRAQKRGVIHRTPWKNFGHNRTESADRAREFVTERGWDPKETYLLVLDADMQLEVEPGFDKEKLALGSYCLMQGQPGFYHPNVRFLRADLDWKSVGVTHEYWAAVGGDVNVYTLDSLSIIDGNDGGNRGTKFTRDRDLLEKALAAEPDNARYMFYLAQTYYDLADYEKAAEWYGKRFAAGPAGHPGEQVYALIKQGRSELALGNAGGVDTLLQAYGEDPKRPDALFYLAVHYREKGKNGLAKIVIDMVREIPDKGVGAFFSEDDIYEWRLDHEDSIVSYYTGQHSDGRAAGDRVSRFRRRGVDYELVGRNLLHYTEPLGALTTGTFDVPEELRGEYESSSATIAATPNGIIAGIRLVNYRHANGVSFDSKDSDKVIRSREVLCELVPGKEPLTYKVAEGMSGPAYWEAEQNIPESWPACHVMGIEDQRFVWHEGTLYFLGNSWQVPEAPGRPQMVLGCFEPGGAGLFKGVKRVMPVRYAGAQHTEKNWLPFVWKGKLCAIYGYEPELVVLEIDPETGVASVLARHETPWEAGRFRGSAGPVQIPGTESYGLLVHEVTAIDGKRIYSQRFMTLSAELRPTRLSPPFYVDHRGVEFPLGMMTVEERYALITYGREERETAYAVVPWAKLLEMATP